MFLFFVFLGSCVRVFFILRLLLCVEFYIDFSDLLEHATVFFKRHKIMGSADYCEIDTYALSVIPDITDLIYSFMQSQQGGNNDCVTG